METNTGSSTISDYPPVTEVGKSRVRCGKGDVVHILDENDLDESVKKIPKFCVGCGNSPTILNGYYRIERPSNQKSSFLSPLIFWGLVTLLFIFLGPKWYWITLGIISGIIAIFSLVMVIFLRLPAYEFDFRYNRIKIKKNGFTEVQTSQFNLICAVLRNQETEIISPEQLDQGNLIQFLHFNGMVKQFYFDQDNFNESYRDAVMAPLLELRNAWKIWY